MAAPERLRVSSAAPPRSGRSGCGRVRRLIRQDLFYLASAGARDARRGVGLRYPCVRGQGE